MDFWIPMALSVLFEILKDRRKAVKFQAALYKLHGALETMFPQLQPENRDSGGKDV